MKQYSLCWLVVYILYISKSVSSVRARATKPTTKPTSKPTSKPLVSPSITSTTGCRVGGGVAKRSLHRGMYLSLYTTKVGSLSLSTNSTNILSATYKQNLVLSYLVANQIDSISL